MPPAGLGAGGPPGAPPGPQIDGIKMVKDLKVPQLIYMLTSMQKSLVDKIFDVNKEFSYNGQDPRMVSDLMTLTQTNAGVPDFENIIEQAKKKMSIEDHQNALLPALHQSQESRAGEARNKRILEQNRDESG